MQLALKSETSGEVIVVRCRGRIVTGEEARFLQSELDKLTAQCKNVVLNLAEVSYLDSGGLGTLVRVLGRLRAARGDLKICQAPPFVEQVFKVTNLQGVFQSCASEREAVDAFSERPEAPRESFQTSDYRIVCLDTSPDLLAYLEILLKRASYEVFATQYPSDAFALVLGARNSVLICGPGMQNNEGALARFAQSSLNLQVLHLPPDFSTSEADQSGPGLVNQIRTLLGPPR